MKESSTYRLIFNEGRASGKAEGKAEGRAEGERTIILRQGRIRFGAPNADTLARLESITSLTRLEQLSLRLLSVETWEELVADEY